MPRIARHIDAVPASGIRRIFEIALQLDDVAMLAVGEPDQPVAQHILDAGAAAWLADDTSYGPNGGLPALRDAFVAQQRREHGVELDRERVWVTVGGTQAIHLAMTLVLQPGDEVLVPDPGYTTFSMVPAMLSAHAVPYALPAPTFLPDVDAIRALVTDRTRAIVLNSPSNPLGVVLPGDAIQAILDLAREHDLWVVSDEVYEHLVWEGEQVSAQALDVDGRVLGVHSVSKSYAMTGARVGFLTVPSGLAERMRTLQEAIVSCVASPDQRAALAAITGPQDAVDVARDHYRANLDLAARILADAGIPHLEPAGAMYLWIDVSHASGGDVAAWAERLLLQERVAVAPGSAFGRSGEGWIRVCLAARPETLERGLRALPPAQR